MTIIEAAKRIGISVSKLYQLVKTHQISHYRVGGRLILHEDDIASFLAGCRIAAAPAEAAIPPPRLKLKHIRLSRDS